VRRESQVGLVRERFFTPRLRFKSYDELNAWLLDKCIAWAKAHGHPERPDRTIWEVFEEERPKLIPYRGRFDGFHAVPAAVSKTCLVRFDNNKYSVSASAVGRPVDIHAYADRIVIRQDGRIVAEHPRCYGRGETVYDPWHYVPVLARKPGAQARRSAQRRAVQGLGVANGAGAGEAQADRVRRRRPADGQSLSSDLIRGSSQPGSPMDCPQWRRPASRHCSRASIRPTSSSTSSRVSAIRDRRRQS
jgi:hypothetical protein